MNANGGSSNRRPRRPRDATRPPSRRSTRETAGRPPDYDRSSQDDDRSRDAPAEREREPAPRRSAWNARPLVLGEIIPPGTADRVRGYLERIAEKEDFVYVRAGGVAWRGVVVVNGWPHGELNVLWTVWLVRSLSPAFQHHRVPCAAATR